MNICLSIALRKNVDFDSYKIQIFFKISYVWHLARISGGFVAWLLFLALEQLQQLDFPKFLCHWYLTVPVLQYLHTLIRNPNTDFIEPIKSFCFQDNKQ